MVDESQRKIVHGEVSVERRVNAPPSCAFQAFADAREREAWGAPTSTAAFIVEREDFREGGADLVRCGDASDPQFLVESRYHRIIPDHLIVFTETVTTGGSLVMVSLQTVNFEPVGNDTGCSVHVQLISFIGEEMIENTERGQNGSLDSLARYLADQKR